MEWIPNSSANVGNRIVRSSYQVFECSNNLFYDFLVAQVVREAVNNRCAADVNRGESVFGGFLARRVCDSFFGWLWYSVGCYVSAPCQGLLLHLDAAHNEQGFDIVLVVYGSLLLWTVLPFGTVWPLGRRSIPVS